MSATPGGTKKTMDEVDLRKTLAVELSQFRGSSDHTVSSPSIRPLEQMSYPDPEQFGLVQPIHYLQTHSRFELSFERHSMQSKLSFDPKSSYHDRVAQHFQLGRQLDQSSQHQIYNDQTEQLYYPSQQFDQSSHHQSHTIQPLQDWDPLSYVDSSSSVHGGQTSGKLKRLHDREQHGDSHVTQPPPPQQRPEASLHDVQLATGSFGQPSQSLAPSSYNDQPLLTDVEESNSTSLPTSQEKAVPAHRKAKRASINQFVSMNRSETVSNNIRKPFTASPLPVWLQQELRTGVCGVYTPAKLFGGSTTAMPKNTSTEKKLYSCILCGLLQTKPYRLRNHFFNCASRRGNPEGNCWYDTPSVLAYYRQQIEKR